MSKITVKVGNYDNSHGNPRVYIEALGVYGLPSGTCILNEVTDDSGHIEVEIDVDYLQHILVRVRLDGNEEAEHAFTVYGRRDCHADMEMNSSHYVVKIEGR